VQVLENIIEDALLRSEGKLSEAGRRLAAIDNRNFSEKMKRHDIVLEPLKRYHSVLLQ